MARLSKCNYRIRNLRGKESVVHVNRLRQAYKQGIWKKRRQEKCYRKQRIRRQEPVEDESDLIAPGPISIPAHQDDREQPTTGTPKRNLPQQMDTPASKPQSLDASASQRMDPKYVTSFAHCSCRSGGRKARESEEQILHEIRKFGKAIVPNS